MKVFLDPDDFPKMVQHEISRWRGAHHEQVLRKQRGREKLKAYYEAKLRVYRQAILAWELKNLYD